MHNALIAATFHILSFVPTWWFQLIYFLENAISLTFQNKVFLTWRRLTYHIILIIIIIKKHLLRTPLRTPHTYCVLSCDQKDWYIVMVWSFLKSNVYEWKTLDNMWSMWSKFWPFLKNSLSQWWTKEWQGNRKSMDVSRHIKNTKTGPGKIAQW